MKDLSKVSEVQLYSLWKNLSIGMLTLVAVMTFSRLLPAFLSPVVAVIATAYIYTQLYNSRTREENACMLIPYALFFCLITYSFISIIVNVLWVWGIIPPLSVPRELIFFNAPFVPSLYLAPSCFITLTVVWFRRKRLRVCRDCKLNHSDNYEKLATGSIISHESKFQLGNLTLLFGGLTIAIYSYYFLVYDEIAINARDWYIFTWITVIAFILNEVYFIFRYYNLYLDLKENDEIITDAELADISAKTYLRYYVICGNSVYMDTHVVDPDSPFREQIDTPFVTRRSVNGIALPEVRNIIERLTGIKGGELRFFFGRKSPYITNHSILRYFYFLDGKPEDYEEFRVSGEWMDFDTYKRTYAQNPGKITKLALSDFSRLATIMLTEKIFNENGFRKNKLKSYTPNFNLIDVRNSDLDFQDEKWIKISLFNSDTKLYRLKKWWKGVTGSNKRSTTSWNK